ncbi:MAG: peptidoglycan editing factor PgeF [Sulfobacillus thermosulfidooxidans]|nr:peptidoglycan editing factor PgeF [Sulfobacillus sp. hq2]POB09330.1 multicopper polyphenol oxidase [Sulfobacillus sp. hq2]PSR31061.1 MAG: peptidoglycan editing factor PgeF [Sulfobacillus thermosulfidooxidans]
MAQWEHHGPYWKWLGVNTVQAIFTTRQGGISDPPYDTLNLSFNMPDQPQAVLENRTRALSWLGASLDQLVMAEQVHKALVSWVGESDAPAGARSSAGAIPGADGLLTRSSDIVLGMGFADCVPIFLADEAGTIGGLLHAGWRGTVQGVQVEAVAQLIEQGIAPHDLHVGIGPSIGPCCYEVDERVAQAFREAMGSDAPLVTSMKPGHYQLDLWTANRRRLEQAGVRPDRIDVAGVCTACHRDQFFSHRRDAGRTGRMGGYLWLKK